MANATGGTIIVGAAETRSCLSAYIPLTEANANHLERAYQEAAQRYLRPTPILNTCSITKDDGFVVIANVQPFPGQPVGVHVKKPETGREGLFHYPVRVSTQTSFITPDQMPMSTDARIRRIAILLEQARGANAEVYFAPAPWAPNAVSSCRATIAKVVVQTNTLELGYVDGGSNLKVPFDLVAGISEAYSGAWQLFVDGCLRHTENGLRLVPRP